MSATLRTDDFTNNTKLFEQPPPVIHVSGRQHPVTVHFSKTTDDNYESAAFKKVAQIHRKLPPGGVLVFMTGREDVMSLVHRLQTTFPPHISHRPKSQEHRKQKNKEEQASTTDADNQATLGDADLDEDTAAIEDLSATGM